MRRHRVGILTCNKPDDYLRSIRLGVQNALEEAGHVLVNINDLIPYHTNANTAIYLRVAFEIASRLNLDVTVIPLGSVHNYIGSGAWEETLELLKLMDPERTVVIEREVPGYRCLTKENASGMRECMLHLIEGHGFTRIAFVSGSADSTGAREREAVYFEEMAAHGLEVLEGYFVRGAFSGDCYDVIDQLIAAHPDIEAIACASDQIAATTYRVMRDRHLVVGRDIAVTGFDDQMQAVHMDPPLTTVHLTGYDFGVAAAREALRLCDGQPQETRCLSGWLVVRNSCGEAGEDELMRTRHLLRQRPFPASEVTQMMVAASLSMAGPSLRAAFTRSMAAFVSKVQAIYREHVADPGKATVLFQSQDLAKLFSAEYQDFVSLEGFHAATMRMLEALLAESSGSEVDWVLDQISYLHLRIARLLNGTMHAATRVMNVREWRSFQLAHDAVAAGGEAGLAYRQMLDDLSRLGVRQADLFLLPESIVAQAGKSLALSDTLHLVGSLTERGVCVPEQSEQMALQELVDRVLSRYDDPISISVIGLMAGDELLGVLSMDPGSLDGNGQLMAALNLGLALKHLQLIHNAREMNELLTKNNLVLELESQHDAMTGLYNRRGFDNAMSLALRKHPDALSALVYLDLDGLKHINDSLGHDAGDEAIKATAEVLVESLPESCLIARMGGDEFVVFAQVASQEESQELTRRIQEGIDRHNGDAAATIKLSASFGVECFRVSGDLDKDVERAMAIADERMYERKRSHRASRRYSA